MDDIEDTAALDGWLDRALERARAAWPELRLPIDRVVARLIELAPSAADREQLRVEDIYLALGCALGDDASLRRFAALHGDDIELALRRVHDKELEPADLRQHLHERLFTPHGGERPRILDYEGKSSLRTWLRVVMLRILLDRARAGRRAERRRMAALPVLEGEAVRDDPEMTFLRAEFRARFREAFAAAFAALTPRQRLLLRQRIVDDLGIDELAELYHVHRATAARWLAAAREAMVAATRDRLTAGERLEGDALVSLEHHCRSALDSSFVSLVREGG
jgi:RNA polymerase sigma-70 factor, ECF subfamily